MKHFIKVFIVALICFIVVIVIGTNAFNLFSNSQSASVFEVFGFGKDDIVDVLLIGLEHDRADTIMVMSYNKKEKTADIISIPRDTYIERKGFANSANNKINSIYGSKGINGLKDTIESITKIKIDKYVTVDYDAVKALVDAVGGVEVNIPFHMRYSDPYSDPPLNINIPKGKTVITGKNAMEFLRFRKSNYEGYTGYAEGDIGRVKAQQEFVKSAIKKSLSLKLPKVIADVYPYVKTDFSMSELSSLALGSVGFSTENIKFNILPGKTATINGISFYVMNVEETNKLVEQITAAKK